MGIHPKIGITGLPKSGKSAVLEKVVEMMISERTEERRIRNERSQDRPIIGGMRTEPILEDGVRVGFECVDIITGDRAVIAHKDIDSRHTILGMGIDPTGLDKVAVPADLYASTAGRA